MSKGVYTKFAKDLAQMKGRIYPLHVGDTFLEPVQQSTVEGIHESNYQAKYKYTLPQGYPELVKPFGKGTQC